MTMRKKQNKDDRSSGDTLRFFPQRHGKYVRYFYTINAMKGSMCLIWQCKGCKKILLAVLEYQAQLLRPLFAGQYED